MIKIENVKLPNQPTLSALLSILAFSHLSFPALLSMHLVLPKPTSPASFSPVFGRINPSLLLSLPRILAKSGKILEPRPLFALTNSSTSHHHHPDQNRSASNNHWHLLYSSIINQIWKCRHCQFNQKVKVS